MPKGFGGHVKALREVRGYSMTDVARHVGCSVTYIHDIERGRRLPSDIMLERLVKCLGADMGLEERLWEERGYVKLRLDGGGSFCDRVALILGSAWRRGLRLGELKAIEEILGGTLKPPRG